MRHMGHAFGILSCVASAMVHANQQPSAAELLQKATDAFRSGRHKVTIDLASRVLDVDSKNVEALMLRAAAHDRQREHSRSIADYDQALQLQGPRANIYHRRGGARFCAGDISGSIEDFDKQIELNPRAEENHWQRGLSYYYAGKYKQGSRQFELGKNYYASDVENVVWRFACQAKFDGVEQARKDMLQLKGTDSRVPMMKVHELFLGKAASDDVFDAAREGNQPPDLNTRMFYAHLYVGLFHDAHGAADLAREHIFEAEKRKISHYMWDVAHVHANMLRASSAGETGDADNRE